MSRVLNYDLNLLKNYLIKNFNCEKIVLSLNEIENIIGGKLPNFSYRKPLHNRFWYNDYNKNPSYAHYWLDAGYKAYCDIDSGVVTFCKSSSEMGVVINRVAAKKFYHSNLDIDEAIAAIKKYHYSVNENYTRYKSWEHCYKAFKLYRHDEEKIEFLCLHLSCYMASWGMLRNSKLINYDYLVHRDFVEKISNAKYDKLYNESFDNTNLINDLVDLINKVYLNKISKKDKLSDTFVTKILLGVFGCVPAYDRYFCVAIRKYKVCSGTFSENSIKDLYSYYQLYYKEFEILRKQFENQGTYYTPMKMIDMCFWQLGYDLENK